MTLSRGDRAPFLRTVLAGVVVVDLVSFFFFLGDARATALAEGIALNTFNDLVSGTMVRGIVVLLGVAGAVAFGRGWGRFWEGVLALGALILLSSVHAQLFGSPWRHLFYSGLCLLGWLLGLTVSRRRGAPGDESYARIGSIALLGAAYLNAGISKIVYGGGGWVSGTPIQAVILGQDGLVADGIVSLYRSWVVATPWVSSFFSVATVGFELAAPLMLAGRRIRLLVAAGLFLMHANIYVLTEILYWESMVFLLVFGLYPNEAGAEVPLRSAASTGSYDRRFAASAAVLAACALLAIAHQGEQYAHHQQPKGTGSADGRVAANGPAMPANQPVPSPTVPLRQIGPLALGQIVAPGWSVESLDISDGGFVAVLSGGPGRRAAFEVTCASTVHRSPFDLGAAHIFYSSDLDFHELEAVGGALQQQVRNAAEDQDTCERLAAWRLSAQAGQAH